MLIQWSLASLVDACNPMKLIEYAEDAIVGNNDSKPTGSKSKRSKRKKRTLSMLLSIDSSNKEEID